MTPQYIEHKMTWPDDFINKVICGDCLEILPQIPDGAVDAVITDPPYGNKENVNYASRNRGRKLLKGIITRPKDWDKIEGNDSPPNLSLLLKFKPLVIFGGQYFADQLPTNAKWYIWDKRCGVTPDDNADCEMAWTNLKGVSRIHRQLWKGICRAGQENIAISGNKLHPFQKPIALMRFIISDCTNEKDIILDPYAGSGTTLVAAKQLGRRYIGIEISPEYCKIAEDRLRQGELFGEVANA